MKARVTIRMWISAALGLAGLGLLGFTLFGPAKSSYATMASALPIEHVVVIMQENRSFDSYFGTYPGAAGIPMANGTPTVCVPDPSKRGAIGQIAHLP